MESSYFSSYTPGSSTNSSKQPLDAPPAHPVFMVKEDSGNGSAEDSDAESTVASARTVAKSPESGRPGLNPVETGGWIIEGAIRRKTILKEGRRPAVQSWTRYWLRLWDTNLLYYPTRSLPPLKGAESRAAFRKNPSKSFSLQGWMVLMGDDPFHPDTFQLQEPSRGNVYKFRLGSQAAAMEWYKELKKAIEKFEAKAPDNLMSFE